MTARTDQTAEALAALLPALVRLTGSTTVVKLGGRAMTDPALQESFAADVALLRCVGARVVVVHGGGPQVTAELDRMGVETVFAAGLRVTTPDTMRVVRMVLVGDVNGAVVRLVNAHGALAVGLSGEDAGLLTAVRRTATVDGVEVDLGLVGDIARVDPGVVVDLLDSGRIPVIATVAPDAAGVLHNVNADTAAAAIAVALGAHRLVVLTDVPGLYADPGDPGSVIASIGVAEVEALLPELGAGMAPKMEACARAVRGGVPVTRVLDGRERHALVRDLVVGTGGGTTVTP